MLLFLASVFLLLASILALLLWPLWRDGERMKAAQLGLGIAVSSVLLYGWFGAYKLVPQLEEYHAEMSALREQIIATSEIVKQHPDNLDAWLTLGEAFSDSGDYNAAAHAFKQAVLLSKGHPRIIIAYAEALILQAEGSVTDDANRSIDMALMLDPSLPLARYYKAVWHLQHENTAQAMHMMKQLYAELPEDSSLKKRMKAEIGRE